MRKATRQITIIILIAISLPVIWLYFLAPEEPYSIRQVQKIASSENNYLLKISQHISQVIRPEETFNFPIELGQQGPINSLYSGKLQYPFFCMTVDSGLEQPKVDNQSGFGVPIYDSLNKPTKILGYSKDCSINSRLTYYRITPTKKLIKITKTQLTQPLLANFSDNQFLRVEQGTINRFIYTLVMPITIHEIGDRSAKSQWNKRLIYQFNGGSGIGYRQGKQRAERVIKRQIDQLISGYAVISSSGNKTSYTYNMLLAEDTARRVKKQFTSLYGKPLYTVGIGGSGGGIAQYLIAQNSSGIVDGIIPLYSYPDMITTTTYALDCDLLNNYFTFRANNKINWQDWQKRKAIEGLNALNEYPQDNAFLQPINQLLMGQWPSFPTGNSECINGYFGLSSFINNPKQGFIRNFFHHNVIKQVNWSYWQDMAHIFGQDQHGLGLSTWDNVGVQYGLTALLENTITFDEFLDINKKIGSWKPQKEMLADTILTPLGQDFPLWLTLWGNHNITNINKGLAKRHQGSLQAMHAAYLSGQVFIGKAPLPIIDVRHYLEDDLDMHHASASFYSRLRIQQTYGHHKNHIIWMAHKDYSPTNLAFKEMDKWLMALINKEASFENVIASKPSQLNDTCFDAQGNIIDQGDNTWDGKWNQQKTGLCQKFYPINSNSRIQAGGNWHSDIFKCSLISIEQAIKKGLYGELAIYDHIDELTMTFPQGVCDYSQPDQGRPNF